MVDKIDKNQIHHFIFQDSARIHYRMNTLIFLIDKTHSYFFFIIFLSKGHYSRIFLHANSCKYPILYAGSPIWRNLCGN